MPERTKSKRDPPIAFIICVVTLRGVSIGPSVQTLVIWSHVIRSFAITLIFVDIYALVQAPASRGTDSRVGESVRTGTMDEFFTSFFNTRLADSRVGE